MFSVLLLLLLLFKLLVCCKRVNNGEGVVPNTIEHCNLPGRAAHVRQVGGFDS